jgi:hypothetical protein
MFTSSRRMSSFSLSLFILGLHCISVSAGEGLLLSDEHCFVEETCGEQSDPKTQPETHDSTAMIYLGILSLVGLFLGLFWLATKENSKTRTEGAKDSKGRDAALAVPKSRAPSVVHKNKGGDSARIQELMHEHLFLHSNHVRSSETLEPKEKEKRMSFGKT